MTSIDYSKNGQELLEHNIIEQLEASWEMLFDHFGLIENSRLQNEVFERNFGDPNNLNDEEIQGLPEQFRDYAYNNRSENLGPTAAQ